MAAEQTCVIVGASLAGAKAAETLRTEGFDGRVVLIDESFYTDNDVDLLTGTHVAPF